jgi:allantoinase
VFLPDCVVRSRRVLTPRGTRPGAIHIRNGRINGVADFDDVPPGCPIDDAGDAVVLPGLVDSHVHVNAAGRTVSEAFDTVTRAAAAGGVTTVIDMPFHGSPPTTMVAAFESRRSGAAGHCFVDVGFWGSVVPGNGRELASLHEAGVLGFKSLLVDGSGDEGCAMSEADLRIVMPGLARIGATLLVHAELPGHSYLDRQSKAAENGAIALLIQLCREYQTRTHIVHLSSSDALAPIFHARTARLPISVETCPHYLYLTAEEIPLNCVSHKCAPPIRDRANREFLWGALTGGLIQFVVSDHTTTPRAGIASLDLSLSIMWTAAAARGYSLAQIAEWMCLAPARFAGLKQKGTIDVGRDADLVIFDPDAAFTVETDALQEGVAQTPYLGHRLRGLVRRTYLRGRRIYERGRPFSPATGEILMRP